MKTPICDFVEDYVQGNATRLHMPGHKGQGDLEKLDITEVSGADCLYHANGIIAQSQQNAAALFGTAKTVYSTEGSSLAIRAMVYLTRLYAGRKPVIAAGRNAHKTFVTAAALMDAQVLWLWPKAQKDLLSCQITPQELDAFLCGHRVDAVYITSPDYLGNMADIQGISRVCHQYGALLLVDNAHGAYLHFLEQSLHPVDLGADLCCDSAHKTLPVLTGGAYLHVAAEGFFADHAENAMSLFASTSPSYLILRSLDRCNQYLSQRYCQALSQCIAGLDALKQKLTAAGYALEGNEPMKLTIAPKTYGYTGTRLAQILLTKNIVCEFSDPDYVVLMLTPENNAGDIAKLEAALLELPGKAPIVERVPLMVQPEKAMSMHEAMMQPGQKLPIGECVGKMLTSPTVSCPPAVPVLVCGERVSRDAVTVMEYYGIESLYVI